MVENISFLVVSVLNLVVDRGVKTTENNVVVVEERKELECGGEMDERCFRKKKRVLCWKSYGFQMFKRQELMKRNHEKEAREKTCARIFNYGFVFVTIQTAFRNNSAKTMTNITMSNRQTFCVKNT